MVDTMALMILSKVLSQISILVSFTNFLPFELLSDICRSERVFWPDDAFHKTNDIPYETIVDYLNKGRIVIANVHAGKHFVLLTGYSDDGDTFAVNDPGFYVDTYSYSVDVVGYRIFDMIRV